MNPQDIRIIPTEKSDSVLDDIVKKYALQDNGTTESLPKAIKILSAAKTFLRGETKQTDLTSLLQKDLQVSQQTAAQISNDVIKDLVPSFKKISEADLAKLSEEEKDALVFGQTKKVEEEKPLTVRPVRLINEVQKKMPQEKIKEPIEKPIVEKTKKSLPPVKRTAPKQSGGSDSYREPVG